MPIIQENPTYFNDKSCGTVALNSASSNQFFRSSNQQHRTAGANGNKQSMTSYEEEDFGEMETFLSSYESGNSYSAPEPKIIAGVNRKYSSASLKGKKPEQKLGTSGLGSLGRLGQLIFKSKQKTQESHSTSVSSSSGLGSPTTCTPDSSLSIFTNSYDDGDSHSSNSNQVSPLERENGYHNFHDCGIYAANMYYNVGESSVFTIHHPNQSNNNANKKVIRSGSALSSNSIRDDDEFEDCVQPYYTNTSFSTFSSNSKRHSVASSTAASTTTSSIVPVPVNNSVIPQDHEGYLKPNEQQLKMSFTGYYNESAFRGQVQQVQVDVHSPKPNGSRLAYSASNTPKPQRTPIYMNKTYFGSNSNGIVWNSGGESSSSTYSNSTKSSQKGNSKADCEPYCSLCASSIMGSPRQQSKMDVAIVKCKECFFSREAEAHIRGFFDKLMREDKQKMDITLKSYDLADLDHQPDRVVVHCAKVQLVIISHHFLQRLKDEASQKPRLSPINRIFRSKNVIAVLLAVKAEEILEGYEPVLPRFREWYSVDLRSTNKFDPEFCKRFTQQFVRIYNVELSNSSNFSVFPKKVTREQPKICITFKRPVDKTKDEVRLELRTQLNSFMVSDVKFENPHTVLLKVPDHLSPDRDALVHVSVFINGNKIGESRIKSELNRRRLEDDELDRMVKMLPPFLGWLDKHIANSLMKHYKECTDYTTDPELELMNGIIICKADTLPTIMHFAAFYGLEQTALIVLEEADGLANCNLKNEQDETPSDIAFARGYTRIGQMIGDYQEISNSYTAYRFIKDLMEKNVTEEHQDENLTQVTTEENVNGSTEEVDHEQAPSSAGSSTASSERTSISPGTNEEEPPTRNRSHPPTPSARKKVFDQRRQYVNVDDPDKNPEAVQTREKRPARSPEAAGKRNSVMLTYDVPRTVNEDYKVPPSDLRPVPKKEETSTPVFKQKNQGPFVTSSGYLIMNDDRGSGTQVETEKGKTDDEKKEIEPQNLNYKTLRKASSARRAPVTQPQPSTSTQIRPIIKEVYGDNVNVKLDPADEQLIELINDFKNNTIDMRMLELLFENWKQRPDVIKSMEERVKILDQLREDYRNCRQLNEKEVVTKKSSTLDKIKTIWKRKKSGTTNPTEMSDITEPPPRRTSPPVPITFTGPKLPPQSFSSATLPSTMPSQEVQPANMDFRASESSYRVSSESRGSDSSSESTHEPTPPPKPPLNQAPLEYRNPLGQRFISSYVKPSPPPSTCDTTEKPCVSANAPIIIARSDSPDIIPYEVPPPPRPVKKLSPSSSEVDLKVSPKPPRKPPCIPEEEPLSPTVKVAPAIPAKPKPKYRESTEDTGPPPLPVKNVITTQAFSYIDYKTKKECTAQLPGAQSYENDVGPRS